MKTTILLLVGAMFLIAACTGPGWEPTHGTACTADAMVCPDGSSVGRVAPSCEFAPCPAVDNVTVTIKPGNDDPLEPFTEDSNVQPPGMPI
ncbi:MAG: hypothetical protein ABIA93_00200 [Candidatus Woesearchaeota archaeon]